MRLNTKLVVMMLSLLVVSLLFLFVLNQYTQNFLVREIQESSTEVSKAIQMSVEDLTSEWEADPSRLQEYLKQARAKGINEINIISNEGEIINSSDPDKIGKKREIRQAEKGLKISKAGGRKEGSLRPYDLVVPVIVGDEQLGYVHINLLLDNIRSLQHDNFLLRIAATSLVFMAGIALTIYLARRYTQPIHALADGVKKVASGDLTYTFPVERKDEIGELAESFNEMVEKLRERESLEKRLYEAEHLSKVGQLASGIAHEIRNPLNYISLAVDHLKNEVLPSCPDRQNEIETMVGKIHEEVRRANHMVLTFMNYGRPLKLRMDDFVYPDLLARVLPLLHEKLLERNISVETSLPPDLPPLHADPEMLRNCVLNFINNSADAMPNGGTITLGAACGKEAGAIRLSFADQGEGIGKDDIARIFQPYFTTKEAGIGLGLAVTERIVREHGGTIEVESLAGQGTTFTVVLPVQQKEIR